ncbi:SMP-30/gluconolactonase/LRE family protein [Opitutus terrae]|uniref:SMP-30/Gluconolaconase/LRE domain protein n=1 Tax=Opitutus terrae (strain DSM 11246 / JCM 15787 / PB90-1) TaxID=452637 RepID=B1ZTC0_OPITP|nr:SMP-30/gluconolactonase/LRE family protein [Opitutus terrae]ACB76574.1 SMP-30/Gluconolaconase/LRE domain protein [Opitutus terrae PB90-1]
MKIRVAGLIGVLVTLANLSAPAALAATEPAAVPGGELITFEFAQSKIFPGTRREVTVYVPQRYDPSRPACVYVNQDGVQFNAPAVFDQLIAAGEMPVTIGVFVRPGVLPAANPATALDRINRSFEYDSLSDAYVRFLLEELLPAVETKVTGDGRALRLSRSGNDRAIGGASSGGIAAFTAAWERPDAFTRVFSAIGSYAGLRGGDAYPVLVRKTEPKPIRVFLQDGANDLNNFAGDWWMMNQTMERALAFAGYEVRSAWGERGHDNHDATAVFADAMRWLWHDWPQPVRGALTKNPTLAGVLIPGEDWQLVSEGHVLTEGPAVNRAGEVFFDDIPASKCYRVGADGRATEFIADTQRSNGQIFGPDGRLYAVATATKQILAYDQAGQSAVIAEGIAGNDLVVAHNGNLYVTAPAGAGSREPSRLWLIRPDGTKQSFDTALRYTNGVALSPDQTLLYVADYRSHWVYSYAVQPDGTLAHEQRFHWLHTRDADDESYADGLKCDREGRLYVATKLGIQVCDREGRVAAIIPTPNGKITNLVFGGSEFDTLYATCFEQVYRRKMKVRGVNAWEPPFRPTPPR